MSTEPLNLNEQQSTLLKEIYYDPSHPAGFGTLDELSAASKLPKNLVEPWLLRQQTYTLHKSKRQTFKPLNSYYVGRPHIQFQADIVDYSKYQTWNQGYKYILMVMDIFSRKAWAFPLKTKSGPEVADTLSQLLSSIQPPKRLQTDEGKEFYNYHVKQVLDKYNIELFSIYSQYKCAHVERLNRTIKNKLEKIFTATNSKNWIDHIDDVMQSYNNRYHRAIGMTPNEVKEGRVEEAYDHQYKDWEPGRVHQRRRKIKFPIGTRVRISKKKGTFGRGYEANWSTEEFFVSGVRHMKDGKVMYKIKDQGGEEIRGSFYPQEIQQVERAEEIYQIDAILDERNRGRRKEYLVSWEGYPQNFNSWVPASSLQSIEGRTRQY